MYQDDELLRNKINLLLDRLERLSVDSVWAHRASGLRGSLIKALEKFDKTDPILTGAQLENLIDLGFQVLTDAASAIPDYNSEHC